MGADWAGWAGLGWAGWAGGYRQTFQLRLFPLQLWRDTAEIWIDTDSGVNLGSKSKSYL